MSKYNYFIVDRLTNAFLCRDGRFRCCPFWGTFPECAKVYRSMKWAYNKQMEIDLYTSLQPIVIEVKKGNRVNAKLGSIDVRDNFNHLVYLKNNKGEQWNYYDYHRDIMTHNRFRNNDGIEKFYVGHEEVTRKEFYNFHKNN